MNLFVCKGRLCRSPEIRTAQSRTEVCVFPVAVDYFRNNEKKADFFDCVAFGKTAANIAKYFDKGSEIVIEGEIHTEKYTDKSGKERTAYRVTVNRFDFCGGKTEEKKETAPADFSEAVDDDDFPF